MKKLKLHIEDLRVDSFGTSGATAAERGTVEGRAALELFADTKLSCVSCGGHTDPCICDPVRPLTSPEDC